MKLSDARRIVSKMVSWSMLSQGIPVEPVPGEITENLHTLLKANKLVEAANKRNKKKQMVIAERGIAALFVAANFSGDDPETADILAMHQTNIVVCLNKTQI